MLREVGLLRRKQREQDRKDKKTYAGMFDKLAKQTEREEAKNKKEEPKEAWTDNKEPEEKKEEGSEEKKEGSEES